MQAIECDCLRQAVVENATLKGKYFSATEEERRGSLTAGRAFADLVREEVEQGRASRTQWENTELTLKGIRSIAEPYGATSVEGSRVTSVPETGRALQEGDVLVLFITPPPKPTMHVEYVAEGCKGRTSSGYVVEPKRVVAATEIHRYNIYRIKWK